MFNHYRVIHFVGIGGIGMSGIAEVLHSLGYGVTGSDVKESATTRRLRTLGMEISIGHREGNIGSAHVVVVSSAIGKDNPEVEEARRRSIPVIPRAEMLAELGRLKYGVLIAGSHGKTTTTSLVSTILIHAGYDPTVIIGGKLISTDSNAALGKGDFFVAEADESDGSFLKLNPTIAVCTNIDREHMDFFGAMDELKRSFVSFLNKAPFYGLSVVCLEDPNVREILPFINRKYLTYGYASGHGSNHAGEADYRAANVKTGFMRVEFDLYRKEQSLGHFELPVSGTHNVLNAVAAIAVAQSLQVEAETIREALKEFKGIKRRCEYKGELSCGVKIFDDYGHHPTEVKSTIKGIKDGTDYRIVTVFQPHRYTRTRDLFDEFASCFSDAGCLYLMDIYAAGEKTIEGVTSERLYWALREKGVDVHYVKDEEEALRQLHRDLKKGDLLLTLGAGDVWKVGEGLLREEAGATAERSSGVC